MLAELNRRQMHVGSDVVVIYQEAAASDPQMAETLRNVLACTRARDPQAHRRPRPPAPASDLTIDSALDLTLALTLPELFHLLVVERGWDHHRYERWLGDISGQPAAQRLTGASQRQTGATWRW